MHHCGLLLRDTKASILPGSIVPDGFRCIHVNRDNREWNIRSFGSVVLLWYPSCCGSSRVLSWDFGCYHSCNFRERENELTTPRGKS